MLRRLDARMLEYSHGEIGWDVFTLEYKVDAPIDTVLDPDAMVKYLKLFNHLWKIKRIESTLSAGWMRIAGGARTFLRVPGTPTSTVACRLYLRPCGRSQLRMASGPACYGGDDTFHSSDGSVLSARGD